MFSLGFVVVVMVNALMGLPYVIKTLSQPMLHVEQQYQYLCASLGIKGWQRLRLIEWRALRMSHWLMHWLSVLCLRSAILALSLCLAAKSFGLYHAVFVPIIGKLSNCSSSCGLSYSPNFESRLLCFDRNLVQS